MSLLDESGLSASERGAQQDSISGARVKAELSQNSPLMNREDDQTPHNFLSAPVLSSTDESVIKQESRPSPLDATSADDGMTSKDPGSRDKGKAKATAHDQSERDVKMEDATSSPVHIPSGPRALSGASAAPRGPPPGPRQQSSATQPQSVSSPLSQSGHTPSQRGHQSPAASLHGSSNLPSRPGGGGRRGPPTGPQAERTISKVDSQGSSKGSGHVPQRGNTLNAAKSGPKGQDKEEQSSEKKEKREPTDEERLETLCNWRAKLVAEHAQLARNARRAIHELEIVTIDLHAAEQRRQIADAQLEQAKAGQLGIDYVRV